MPEPFHTSYHPNLPFKCDLIQIKWLSVFVKIPLLLDRFCIEKSKKIFFFVFYKRIRIEERIRNYIFKVRCIGSSCDDIDLPNTHKVLTYSFVVAILLYYMGTRDTKPNIEIVRTLTLYVYWNVHRYFKIYILLRCTFICNFHIRFSFTISLIFRPLRST